MPSFRLAGAVKYVNLGILVLLLAGAGLAYWFVWRPLPQRSGSISSPAQASVAFDTLGVPHIRATTLDDALFAQGYVTAQDRLFQMDVLRRLNAGDLAEVFGTPALESDREMRRLRLRRIAEEAYVTLPPADRAAFAAYTRGVNHYINAHLKNLPVEFTLAQYEPRPWSVVDSLLICLNMYRSLSMSWRDDLVKRRMLTDGDPAKVDFLFPIAAGPDGQPGSNAWALAGSRTASGKPLLTNDMHLEYSVPGIWYMTHIDAAGMNVSGVALPGAPGIIVGHNQRIAWGITNLHFDVQDLYIEQFDERTGRYEAAGQVEQARLEREIIRVKGKPNVESVAWITRHGPLFATEGSSRMVLRWVLGTNGLIEYPILDINRAQNWQQFTAALARFPGPAQNFVYADVDGNIGYHAAGKLPKRRGFTGDVPADASSGADWDGFIPFDQLPSIYNPPEGMIVTANQNPFPANYPYPVNGNFAPPYRVRQIRNLLAARKNWRAEEMLAVQTDIYSQPHHFLASKLVEAFDRRKQNYPRLEAAVNLLRGWNGQMDKDLAAPFVTALAYQHLRNTIAEAAAPGLGATYEFSMAPTAVMRILREQPAGWFRDYDEMLLRVLVDAVEEGTRMQGRDIGS
ncbi:MAG TPA: penicillin acylase family protein, partial [Candidatus Solibacter sp.]|nr:penicillin acylase family protein [Candidatus Solibacter sp.]